MNRITPTLLACTFGGALVLAGLPSARSQSHPADQTAQGIAAQFPGDFGIEQHPSVIFKEDFEAGSLQAVARNWDWTRGDQTMLSLDSDVEPPAGSPGRSALKMSVHRGGGGSSADMRKIFDTYYPTIHVRFYVRFAEDYGRHHHFTRIRGELDPVPQMIGASGRRPTTSFSAAIETMPVNVNYYPARDPTTPPGYWFFYVYWPDMRSFQNPDGSGTIFYGNPFLPNQPVAARRGQWQCIEIMVRLNSAPGVADGALALWVDGQKIGEWDPKAERPAQGYWMRDRFRWDPEHADAADFPGFEWVTLRPEQMRNFKNVLQLHHYVSGETWEQADQYARQNPDFRINTREATVWKDHIVVATEYIGPMQPAER